MDKQILSASINVFSQDFVSIRWKFDGQPVKNDLAVLDAAVADFLKRLIGGSHCSLFVREHSVTKALLS